MVASDTMVGIVGAVVLGVALVGVFVYEANAADPAERSFEGVAYMSTVSGTAVYTAATPGTGPTGVGATPSSYALAVTFSNASMLRNNELFYRVFVGTATSLAFVDVMSASGDDFALTTALAGAAADAVQNADTILITLELARTATTPGVPLALGIIAGGSVSFNGEVSLAPTMAQTASVGLGNGIGTFRGDLHHLGVYPGLVYKVWFVDDQAGGAQYTLAGNFSMPTGAEAGTTFNQTVDFRGTADTNGTFDAMVVTLESAASTAAVASGFEIFRLEA